MIKMKLSAPAEDCLLLVHRLGERAQAASTSGLARSLGVTDSTVTAMVQKLARLKLLRHRSRREILLTAAGYKITRQLIRRHRLIETYLCTRLGYTWDEVHDEAERLEHVVSDRFIEAVSAALGHPELDPHGDPIPDAAGVERQRNLISLAAAPAGHTGRVARVLNASTETLTYLGRLGMTIGTPVEILAAPEHDAILHLRVADREVALGKPLAEQVFIEPGS
jgi:DtxR family transcriptional regulator, Mn-dependent transcriptional regulator